MYFFNKISLKIRNNKIIAWAVCDESRTYGSKGGKTREGKKVSQYSIYVLTYENGEIKRVSTRDEIASELNVSLTTISKHLNLNPEGVTFKTSAVTKYCVVKKIGVFSK